MNPLNGNGFCCSLTEADLELEAGNCDGWCAFITNADTKKLIPACQGCASNKLTEVQGDCDNICMNPLSGNGFCCSAEALGAGQCDGWCAFITNADTKKLIPACQGCAADSELSEAEGDCDNICVNPLSGN